MLFFCILIGLKYTFQQRSVSHRVTTSLPQDSTMDCKHFSVKTCLLPRHPTISENECLLTLATKPVCVYPTKSWGGEQLTACEIHCGLLLDVQRNRSITVIGKVFTIRHAVFHCSTLANTALLKFAAFNMQTSNTHSDYTNTHG